MKLCMRFRSLSSGTHAYFQNKYSTWNTIFVLWKIALTSWHFSTRRWIDTPMGRHAVESTSRWIDMPLYRQKRMWPLHRHTDEPTRLWADIPLHRHAVGSTILTNPSMDRHADQHDRSTGIKSFQTVFVRNMHLDTYPVHILKFDNRTYFFKIRFSTFFTPMSAFSDNFDK